MNDTRDIDEIETADDERGLDPREAANLLEQTRRQAERRFDFRSPGLSLLGAAVVLIAFGAVWLSVRGQHPYTGPTAAGLLAMYGILICWFGVVAMVARRATAGVSGRSTRQQRAYGAAVVTTLVAVSVFQGVLKHDGVSHAIVYGIYPPTAQLIVLGTLGAAIAAGREDWPGFGVAIAIILVVAGSAFAGPRGVWLSDGVGCCVAVLGYSTAQAWLRRVSIRRMTADTLDPLIHVPARLQIVDTPAALPDGDALSFTRLQDMIGLTAGNLITHLRKLEDAGYLATEKTCSTGYRRFGSF